MDVSIVGHQRRLAGLGVAVAVLGLSMLLGGCGGGDDGGGGGGGGLKFPSAPTARPSLAGMVIRVSANGGNNSAGAGGDHGIH